MSMYRIDEQTKTVYEYSEEHNAYLFYAKFAALTKAELREIRRLS